MGDQDDAVRGARVRQMAALGALLAVGWCLVSAWSAIVHAHPAYPILLGLTALVALAAVVRARRHRALGAGRRSSGGVWRIVWRIAAAVAAFAWVAAIVWLRPSAAVEPALAALVSDASVTVTEDATRIVLAPAGTEPSTGMFFQPGAKVDARAYAAVLRPLAEDGRLVVIAKQPLSLAFLATDAFASTRPNYPAITRWVVGGHSLGGVVAASDAAAHDDDAAAPVVGLLLFASYPAGDLSDTLTAAVLSVSASNDGLATPAKIEASRAMLPASATFTVIDGAVHSSFGDYGPQDGDGVPTVDHDAARRQLSEATTRFVAGVAG